MGTVFVFSGCFRLEQISGNTTRLTNFAANQMLCNIKKSVV